MAYGKFVSGLDDLPEGEHWVIIKTESVDIPGDERSRTHPGHGYPAHTKTYISYEAFTDKAEFEAEVQRRMERKVERAYSGDNFLCIHVTEVLRPGVKAVFEWK